MTDALAITEPGLYSDVSNEDYHADPVVGGSLSNSGARRLLPPSCPALFDYYRRHPEPPKQAFEFGHLAHKLVLDDDSTGITEIDAANYKTKAAQQARDAARDIGLVPVLPHELKVAEEMADAIRRHPVAGRILVPGTGRAEQTLIWRDERTGVMRRARLDWLPTPTDGRLILTDYKTCHAADDESLGKAVYNFGYDMQDDCYTAGAAALGLSPAGPPVFLFIAQEKTAPYLVTVFELDSIAKQIGRARNNQALDTYVRCVTDNHWPAYHEELALVRVPRWAEIKEGIAP